MLNDWVCKETVTQYTYNILIDMLKIVNIEI